MRPDGWTPEKMVFIINMLDREQVEGFIKKYIKRNFDEIDISGFVLEMLRELHKECSKGEEESVRDT